MSVYGPNNDGASHPRLAPGVGLPPHNTEAEMGALGSMIADNTAIPEVVARCDPGDFYRDADATIARAIWDMADAGRPVDYVTLPDELARRGVYARVGGDDYLADLLRAIPHSGNAAYYAGIVREKAVARRLIDAHNRAIADCYSNDYTADDLVARSEEAVFAVADAGRAAEDVTLQQGVGLALDAIDARKRGDAAGVLTGLDDLDGVLGGLMPGQLVILAARPSMGKSALGMNIACHAAGPGGWGVRFVSLEMSAAELAERYLAAEARVDGYSLKYPRRLGDADTDRIGDVYGAAAGSKLVLSEASSLTVAKLAADARRHKARKGLGLVVVDYLQLIDGQARKGELREQEVARVSRRLKSLAMELKVPVLALCQLNRAVEGRDGHKPRLADLRESGQIEQDAHAVLLLHRPDYYDPDDRPGEVDLIVAKNRNGATGLIRLAFNRAESRFENYTPV